jgi:hypothetical protein
MALMLDPEVAVALMSSKRLLTPPTSPGVPSEIASASSGRCNART